MISVTSPILHFLSAGIDTFENHCCDPNTDSVWAAGSLTKYLCVATKPIRIGDEITCVQNQRLTGYRFDFKYLICYVML